jgi:UDP-GlcNAc:undecaprenyl-phosphate GlcNAc-1-phosphate transferase
MNLIDGVDGLAAGVGFFATTTMLLAALLQGNLALAVATVPMVGCLIGFLRYNFNPATIFLGDSGSLLIGFLLGCYGVLWSQKSATILGMTAPLIALSVPLIDTTLAIVRRYLRSKSIFAADRGHIHHRLLDRGLTHREVAMVFYGLCSAAAMFSLSLVSERWESLVILLFCCVAGACIHRLGYIELGVAGRMFTQGAFRRQISSQIALKHYEELLVSAETPEECWAVIEQACREFGFHRVRLRFAGRVFEYDDGLKIAFCNILVPISDFDAIQLSRAFESPLHSGIMAPLSDMLHRTLGEKVSAVPKPEERRYRLVSRTTG